MKLSVKSLFDPTAKPWSIEWDDEVKLKPRTFVDLLDQHKALLLSLDNDDDVNDTTRPCLTAEDFGKFAP